MRLILIRHAAAEPRRAGLPDASRAVTPQGRSRFRGVVAGLRRLRVRCDRLYHSPMLRAVQSADLLAPLVDGETVATPNLARAPGAALLDDLEGERVALVGHEPWISALAAWLVTGDRRRGPKFAMKKGGVVILDGDPRPGAMRLVAALPPKATRRLARR